MFSNYVFIFYAVFLSAISSDRISLEGNDWIITDHSNYTVQGQIPGTIHTILLAANQITDPYLRFNDFNLRYLILSNWTFRKQFAVNPSFLISDQINIYFEQIDTVSNVKVNNCSIGNTDSMFIPYTFVIPHSCLKLNNEIQIDFQSPILYAKDKAREYNQSVPPDCPPPVQHGECYVQFIRKEPCSFSWGWVRNVMLSKNSHITNESTVVFF